jgi:chitin synthase
LPVLLYGILFRKCQPIFEVVRDTFSFIFYTPSYIIILNVYAICRIDDISWGTKGLDQSKKDNSKAKLEERWKIIKTIHLGKFVIWNIIASVLLLSFSESYVPKFYITLVIMGIISLTLLIKVLLSVIYLVKYKLTQSFSKVTDIKYP